MSADKDVAFASPAIDSTTITSLLAVAFLLTISYLLSRRLLAVNTPVGLRVIYIWHLFDALIHVLFEGSFLYNCFFVFKPGNSLDGFLNQPLRTYGANYGSSPTSKLWQEYAKADARWGGADVTVISIELLTVIIGGPLAAWICEGIRRQDSKAWFWMILLATGELYGGFMTFSPEWLTGSQNLDTSNALYLYIYLIFFNGLWVVFPLYILYEAYGRINHAFSQLDRGEMSPASGDADVRRNRGDKKKS